ncbi:MAG: hypothetical protein ACI4XM_06045 [Candidatus Coprovivens sp.]
MLKKMKEIFLPKNIGCGYLYFYIHLITEIICFYYLSSITDSLIIWLIPFIYDGLAFVPQALIGKLNDKYPKLNLGIIGTILLFIAIFIYSYTRFNIFISLIIICLGNACIHVRGAEVTLKNSEGKMSHSAIFVAGGSFGVILGKLLGTTVIPKYLILILILTMIPFIILADMYDNSKKEPDLIDFNYHNQNTKLSLVIIASVLVVIIRGFMGYGIPTSWNKTTIEAIIFYFTMGLGKALGGILIDSIGIRKTSIISTILAIPFLCFGNNYMLISLIGVMFFSMTMSVTLAILVSCLKKSPGLAFGLTTIGLFLGTAPIFFFKLTQTINIILIITLSILCLIILLRITRKKEIT